MLFGLKTSLAATAGLLQRNTFTGRQIREIESNFSTSKTSLIFDVGSSPFSLLLISSLLASRKAAFFLPPKKFPAHLSNLFCKTCVLSSSTEIWSSSALIPSYYTFNEVKIMMSSKMWNVNPLNCHTIWSPWSRRVVEVTSARDSVSKASFLIRLTASLVLCCVSAACESIARFAFSLSVAMAA